MKYIHEKSFCCSAKIYRFGERRRQCSQCRKTWRVWQRKRGRGKQRIHFHNLHRYFEGELPHRSLEKHTRAARLRKSVHAFNAKTAWHVFPDGPLIAIADGLIEYFCGKKYALYLILLRSVSGEQAVIAAPYFHAGMESGIGWNEAFIQLPAEVRNRIVALVCDGHTGLLGVGQRRGWAIQRCHFHLLARIEHNVSFGRLGKKRRLGLRLQKLVQGVLYGSEDKALTALSELSAIKQTITSRNFKTVLSGFEKNYREYRTYLLFPRYRLPTTSNSAEHLVGRIRDLQYRARGFRTPRSFMAWITAFCKHQQTITCRPKFQPN